MKHKSRSLPGEALESDAKATLRMHGDTSIQYFVCIIVIMMCDNRAYILRTYEYVYIRYAL